MFSTQKGKGKGKPKPICRDFMTDTGCSKGGQCLYQHPNTVGRCLRCGSTKHVVADCKRPRRDPSANNKGKGRSTSSAPSKTSSLPHLKQRLRPRVMPRSKQGKGKTKPQAKASANATSSSSAQIHTPELMWAIAVMGGNDTPVTDAALPSASLACSSTTWSYSACAFYTTFTPALHSSKPTDENGTLPPILVTGCSGSQTSNRSPPKRFA